MLPTLSIGLAVSLLSALPLPQNTTTPASFVPNGVFPVKAVSVSLSMPPPKAPQGDLRVGCEQYRNLFEKYDWDASVALQVCDKESGGVADNVNDNPGTGDYSVGLMQANLYGSMRKTRPSEESLKVPENNIAFAYKLWSAKRDFHDWSTCKSVAGCR